MYQVEIKETGDVLNDNLTLKQAEAEVAKNEQEDRANGIFEENWYFIRKK